MGVGGVTVFSFDADTVFSVDADADGIDGSLTPDRVGFRVALGIGSGIGLGDRRFSDSLISQSNPNTRNYSYPTIVILLVVIARSSSVNG